MPTYEYECQDCQERFEYFQSMTEAPKQECERCGGRLVRLIGAGAGLIFKGSGFYITDYKGKSPSGEAKSEKADSGGEAKGEATKPSESKPSAAKADSGKSDGSKAG